MTVNGGITRQKLGFMVVGHDVFVNLNTIAFCDLHQKPITHVYVAAITLAPTLPSHQPSNHCWPSQSEHPGTL
jgi:hypothetical protein